LRIKREKLINDRIASRGVHGPDIGPLRDSRGDGLRLADELLHAGGGDVRERGGGIARRTRVRLGVAIGGKKLNCGEGQREGQRKRNQGRTNRPAIFGFWLYS